MDTFKIMWQMSLPGSGAEECFLQLKQTHFYQDEKDETPEIDAFKDMPNVCHSDTLCFDGTNSININNTILY